MSVKGALQNVLFPNEEILSFLQKHPCIVILRLLKTLKSLSDLVG